MTKSVVLDESMSNLTSASGEVSASSGSRNDTVSAKPHQTSTSTNQKPQPKKKRGLQGNPDPDAEVIAFSPKSLLATNRFICEICNKGFQREQNLQLHRRGHNLPWKLKQRTNKEVIRKKVYVCPEPTCAHHDPSRALGDLTGIKKHFSRKHGEKKWKCEKCSKRYAVQSDWKAHSKICGTREYRCDCGTIFSRRDSFITHRAFCDALAQENTRGITAMIPTTVPFHPHLQSHSLQALSSSVKSEPELNSRSHHIPPWLQVCTQVGENHVDNFGLPPMNFSYSLQSPNLNPSLLLHHENPNPNSTIASLLPSLPSSAPHMSATSLLQKASQIGVAMSKPLPSFTMLRSHHPHLPQGSARAPSSLPLVSEMGNGFSHGLASYSNQVGSRASGHYIGEGGTVDSRPEAASALHNMMGSFPSASGFGRSSSFEEALSGILNPPRDGNHFNEILSKSMRMNEQSINEMNHINGDGTMISGVYNGNDETTRDFLGLKAVSREPFFSTSAGLHQTSSTSYGHQDENQASWHQGRPLNTVLPR